MSSMKRKSWTFEDAPKVDNMTTESVNENVEKKMRLENGDLSKTNTEPNGKTLGSSDTKLDTKVVVVVGAGPAGLMLASNLARFGIDVKIIDDRAEKTVTGRADGMQPKTIETFRQMGLADDIFGLGVKVYDISFWNSTPAESLHRTAREIHYPSLIDVLDPHLILLHQGIVEEILLRDLSERGVSVRRPAPFVRLDPGTPSSPLNVVFGELGNETTISAGYLVGCDGAHSRVRRAIPGSDAEGASSEAIWGVLDGELETDFPDLWSKVVVHSEKYGSILLIPRERNMTRLYIELKPEQGQAAQKDLTREFVMKRAKAIMAPYNLSWRTVEWFSRYQIGQRVASKFVDDTQRVFIAGDASHTHSPKAAQGMNTSMHDAWNLAWKINLAVRGLAKPALLSSYETERRKIAQDLIAFDYEHANAFAAGDEKALAENFKTNIRFISGVGAEYAPSKLNAVSEMEIRAGVKPGCLLPPAKVSRYIDANPVDAQLDIPFMGQFRIYVFTPDIHASSPFLDPISQAHTMGPSYAFYLTKAAKASYHHKPRIPGAQDQYTQPQRYLEVSPLFSYALVTSMPKHNIEILDLPPVFRDSRWAFYLDNVRELDTRKRTCTEKWVGALTSEEIAVLVVRPDGYVGALKKWTSSTAGDGMDAVVWLDSYFSEFLDSSAST